MDGRTYICSKYSFSLSVESIDDLGDERERSRFQHSSTLLHHVLARLYPGLGVPLQKGLHHNHHQAPFSVIHSYILLLYLLHQQRFLLQEVWR